MEQHKAAQLEVVRVRKHVSRQELLERKEHRKKVSREHSAATPGPWSAPPGWSMKLYSAVMLSRLLSNPLPHSHMSSMGQRRCHTPTLTLITPAIRLIALLRLLSAAVPGGPKKQRKVNVSYHRRWDALPKLEMPSVANAGGSAYGSFRRSKPGSFKANGPRVDSGKARGQ